MPEIHIIITYHPDQLTSPILSICWLITNSYPLVELIFLMDDLDFFFQNMRAQLLILEIKNNSQSQLQILLVDKKFKGTLCYFYNVETG